MSEIFALTEFVGPETEGADGDDDLEFRVSKPPTGWTEQDTGILEAALDLAGLTDPAERLKAAMAVDIMGIIILMTLVRSVENDKASIREFFERLRGGIGK